MKKKLNKLGKLKQELEIEKRKGFGRSYFNPSKIIKLQEEIDKIENASFIQKGNEDKDGK